MNGKIKDYTKPLICGFFGTAKQNYKFFFVRNSMANNFCLKDFLLQLIFFQIPRKK